MRKVGILVLAFALVVGMSFGVMAQTNNSATVEQSGESELDLDQIGNNEATIDQENGSLAGIRQEGNNNIVDLTQNGATAGIVQFQTEGAEIEVTQGEGSYIGIVQMVSPNMKVDATQGKNDEAYIGQYDANEIVLTQNEGENSAYLYQDSNIDPGVIAGNNIIRLDQSGGSNAAIYQNGQDNTFNLEQNQSSKIPSNIYDETNEWNWAHPDNQNLVFFEQEGINNNLLGIGENGNYQKWAFQYNSLFTGDQDGENNLIRLHQVFGDATINQSGNNNTSFLYQNTTQNDWSNHNTATINQTDVDGNTAKVSQIGNNNVATVIQNSDNNMVDLDQSGDGNVADINQE